MRASLLLLLSGCSAALVAPAGPGDPPGPADARVVVRRPRDRNPHRAYAVYDGMELKGFVFSGSAMEFLCAPGPHLFLLVGSSDAAVQGELEAGKTYVLRAGAEPRFLRLRLLLEPWPDEDEELEELPVFERDPEASEAFLIDQWDRISERLAWYAGDGQVECAELRKEQGR